MNKNFLKNVVGVFENHKETSQVFVTSDGQVFLNKNNAQAHANNQDDKRIAEITREQAESMDMGEAERLMDDTLLGAEQPKDDKDADAIVASGESMAEAAITSEQVVTAATVKTTNTKPKTK